jgi:hypothetical protein
MKVQRAEEKKMRDLNTQKTIAAENAEYMKSIATGDDSVVEKPTNLNKRKQDELNRAESPSTSGGGKKPVEDNPALSKEDIVYTDGGEEEEEEGDEEGSLE